MPASRHRSHRSPGTARRVAVLLGIVGVFTTLAWAGDALSPVLLPRHRLALIALTPRTAYMVAAAGDVPLPAFVLVAVARLCAADPVHFMLGRSTGPAVLARARRWRQVRSVADRMAHRMPSRTGALWLAAIVLSPTAKTMLAAGAAGQRAGRVAAANFAGTTIRVMLVWGAGRAFPALGETLATAWLWVTVPGGIVTAGVVGVRHRAVLRDAWTAVGRKVQARARAESPPWRRLPRLTGPAGPRAPADSAATA
jgi:membrane protein DedA with SNARE-associated domain